MTTELRERPVRANKVKGSLMNVVVIEDNADIALWVTQALSFVGDFNVKCVTANFDALIGNGQWDNIDAVLSDWHLGTFETERLLEWLARNRPHVRRVVFTAFPIDQVRRDIVDCVVQKPASMDKLAQALMEDNFRGDELEF